MNEEKTMRPDINVTQKRRLIYARPKLYVTTRKYYTQVINGVVNYITTKLWNMYSYIV